jgi:hypothetical protein
MTRSLFVLVLLAFAASAAAQNTDLPWRTDPQPAVAEARQQDRPLLVYVLAGTKDRDDKLELAHRRSFSDPRVQRLAQRFVPLKLSRSVHRDVLKDFGLPESANMVMTFVTPDGKVLGDSSAGGIAQPDSLAAKLVAALQSYAEALYEERLKPVLENADAQPADVKAALRTIGELRITVAEQDLFKFLARDKLDAALRSTACETLAALSTKTIMAKLLDLSGTGDKAAAKALEKCTPVGAEYLWADLQPDATPFDYPLYKIIAKICDVREAKPEKWFDTAKPQARQDHLAKIEKLVHEAAKRWKEANDVPDRPAQ